MRLSREGDGLDEDYAVEMPDPLHIPSQPTCKDMVELGNDDYAPSECQPVADSPRVTMAVDRFVRDMANPGPGLVDPDPDGRVAAPPDVICLPASPCDVQPFPPSVCVDDPVIGHDPAIGHVSAARYFETGATRDSEVGKLDYEGFLSHEVLQLYAEYMNVHRIQSDGHIRDSDNWQKGMPRDVYMKSAFRHFMDVWASHRDPRVDFDREAACALLFNIMGYLHEELRDDYTSKPEEWWRV